MTIAVTRAGEFGGKRVDQFTLTSTDGVKVDLLSWGVTVRDWQVPISGGTRSVVLGFDTFEPYPKYSAYFGSLAGRVANRIENASFTLDGQQYEVQPNWFGHTLHGGREGLGHVVWDAETDEASNAVRFTHLSPDGHMGFPGNVQFTATYTLTGKRLRLELRADADRRTPINVVQHQYFNLGTGTDVLDHKVRIAASAIAENGSELIPTGRILPVDGTIWDFRAGRTLRHAGGLPIDYDGNLVLDTGRDLREPVVAVTDPEEELMLRLWTDRPAVQFYNSVWTNVSVPDGKQYAKHSGFCLEDQDFPDAVHRPYFPSIIYGPDRPYTHWCEFEIA